MPANTILFPGIFPLGLAMKAAKLVPSQTNPASFTAGEYWYPPGRTRSAPNQSVELRAQLVLRLWPDGVAGLALAKRYLSSRAVLRRRNTRRGEKGRGKYGVCS